MSSAADPDDGLAAYDDLIAAAARRYGWAGQGVGYVLYEKLIHIRTCLVEQPASMRLRAHAHDTVERLRLYYRDGSHAPGAPAATQRGDDPIVMEFDRRTFVARGYDKAATAIAPELIRLGAPGSARPVPGSVHLFVLDDAGDVVLWNRPFRYPDLAFGLDRAQVCGVPVAHPMLVPQRLRAVAAGEIVVIGDDRIGSVIVNTRSGHFRPPPSCERPLRERLSALLDLADRDIDVIAVTTV